MAQKDKEIAHLKTDLQQSYRCSQELRTDVTQFRNALRNAEECNHQLKISLADETRVKIELFTALSESRRYHDESRYSVHTHQSGEKVMHTSYLLLKSNSSSHLASDRRHTYPKFCLLKRANLVKSDFFAPES